MRRYTSEAALNHGLRGAVSNLQTRIAHLEARVQAADALAKTLDDWQIPLHPYVARELAAYRATEAAP